VSGDLLRSMALGKKFTTPRLGAFQDDLFRTKRIRSFPAKDYLSTPGELLADPIRSIIRPIVLSEAREAYKVPIMSTCAGSNILSADRRRNSSRISTCRLKELKSCRMNTYGKREEGSSAPHTPPHTQ
jgi:hypothetical protein